MRDGTIAIRSGLPDTTQGSPFMPGPVFAGTYHLKGDPSGSPYTYGRYHNPTWTNYERALGLLEGGDALVFSSGMAAITAVLSAVLLPELGKGKNHPVLVMPSDSYYAARVLSEQHFGHLGVKVLFGPTYNNGQIKLLDDATLLWIETPSNPGLDVCSIRELVEAAHEAGALVAVDNTVATPLGQKPLRLGADFSVSSDTKAMTGHSDLVLGHVAAGDKNLIDKVRAFRTQQGAIPGPMEVWLAHRSLATLEVRLERQCRNAREIAKLLSERDDVLEVRYPGLKSDPSYKIASSQMRYFGPVVSFVLKSKEDADRFLEESNLVESATSFGSVHTTAERRGRWGGDVVPDGFIRLSAGCEDQNDLIEDINHALDCLQKH